MMNLYRKIAIFVIGAMLSHKDPVPTYPAPTLAPKTLEMVKKFTVLISIEGFGGGDRGTGELIDSAHVLTCVHMLESDTLWIYTYPIGRVIIAHPVWADQRHDLAILELEHPVALKHYAVVITTTTIGQTIAGVGNTLGA